MLIINPIHSSESIHLFLSTTCYNVHSVVYSCQLAYPGGCCTSNYCYLGTVGSEQCSCSAECFTNEHIPCCSDIGCPRKFR